MNFASTRSILFVPGDSPRKLARARSVGADAFILDWEDAVADDRKAPARDITRSAIGGLRSVDALVLLRINARRRDLLEEDCRVARECRPDGVVLPKCEQAAEVAAIAGHLPDTALVPLLESPRGVLHAAGIAAASPRVCALMFGAEDYSAECRIRRSPGEPELHFARAAVVNAARAHGREVFDSPLMQYRDLSAVRAAASAGRRLGFTGQAAIHPVQVPVINGIYSPSAREVAEARAVLDRYRAHGGGVYGVEGVLEDRPAVRDALKLLERAERASPRSGSAAAGT